MRILHVTKKYPNAIGGDATCVFNLERELRKRGDEVFILTTNCPEIIDKDNLYKFGLKDISHNWDRVTVKRVLSLLFFLWESLLEIKKIKPDIIHTHSADLGFIIAIWAKIFRIPVINTCHALSFPYKFIPKLKRYPEWFFLKFGLFSKIVTVDSVSNKFLKEFGIRNCEYVNMLGVDMPEFETVEKSILLEGKPQYTKFLFCG